MTGFPTLSYTSTFEVKNPFIFLEPEKGTPFGRSLPVYAIIGGTPSPPRPLEPMLHSNQQQYMLLPLTLLHCWVVSKPRLLFHFLISGLANGWKLPLLQKLKKKIMPLNSFQQYRQILFMLTMHVLKVAWERWSYSQ